MLKTTVKIAIILHIFGKIAFEKSAEKLPTKTNSSAGNPIVKGIPVAAKNIKYAAVINLGIDFPRPVISCKLLVLVVW